MTDNEIIEAFEKYIEDANGDFATATLRQALNLLKRYHTNLEECHKIIKEQAVQIDYLVNNW